MGTQISTLTSSIGLALSCTDRMCVTLFLLNCSASLASVTEKGDFLVFFASELLLKEKAQNYLHISSLKIRN